ncbi:MAG: hypothetical protein ACI9WU_001622 [Myxococcota bacterium]|jgi:hypothetical protein
MATITKLMMFPFMRHCQGEAHTHLIVTRGGKVVREGRGLGFWFGPVGTAISEVPVNDQSVPVMFKTRSQDFQDVSISGQVWYTAADLNTMATRFDFSLNTDSGVYNADPLTVIQGALVSAAQEAVWSYVSGRTLEDLLASELSGLSKTVSAALTNLDFGANVTRSVVTAVRPEKKVEAALQAKTRERLQMEADAAGFERRAKATEQERAIAEAELANQLALAKKREALIAQNDANAQAEAQSTASLERIATKVAAENADVRAAQELRVQISRDTAALAHQSKLGELAEAELRSTLTLYAGEPEASRTLALAQIPENLSNLRVLTIGEGGLQSALERLATDKE